MTSDEGPTGIRLAIVYVTYYGNPRVLLPLLTGTEWDENWRSWPHCNTQGGCWMHCTTPPAPWCNCVCRWCRIARRVHREAK